MVLVIILIRLAGSKPQRYSPDWDVLSRCPARLLLPQMGPLDCNSLRSFRCDGTAPHQLTPAGLNAVSSADGTPHGTALPNAIPRTFLTFRNSSSVPRYGVRHEDTKSANWDLMVSEDELGRVLHEGTSLARKLPLVIIASSFPRC